MADDKGKISGEDDAAQAVLVEEDPPVIAEVIENIIEPKKNWGDLSTRVISGIVMAIAAALSIYMGGVFFSLLIFILGCIVVTEWAGLHKVAHQKYMGIIIYLYCFMVLKTILGNDYFITLGYFSPFAWIADNIQIYALFVALFAPLCILLLWPKRQFRKIAFGLIYVVITSGALLYIRGNFMQELSPDLANFSPWQSNSIGLLLTIWVIVSVWMVDIGAYFAGRTFGGPKSRRASARPRHGRDFLAAWRRRLYLGCCSGLLRICR